jgi:putative oxidoreductase
MSKLKSLLIILGRVLISLFFLLSALNKMVDWQETERSLVSLLCDWHSYVSSYISLQQFFGDLLAWVPALLIVMTGLEILGGLFLFFGFQARLGAFCLILVLIPLTILLHPFWFFEGIKREQSLMMFMRNLALLGGLFFVSVFGGKEKKKAPPQG